MVQHCGQRSNLAQTDQREIWRTALKQSKAIKQGEAIKHSEALKRGAVLK